MPNRPPRLYWPPHQRIRCRFAHPARDSDQPQRFFILRYLDPSPCDHGRVPIRLTERQHLDALKEHIGPMLQQVFHAGEAQPLAPVSQQAMGSRHRLDRGVALSATGSGSAGSRSRP